jgi:hypothetical protein
MSENWYVTTFDTISYIVIALVCLSVCDVRVLALRSMAEPASAF